MKKPFYDIIPNEKRSIRNIPLNKKSDATIESSLDTRTSSHDSKIHHPSNAVRPAQQYHSSHHSTDGIRTKPHSQLNTSHKSTTKTSARRDEEIEPEIVDEDLEMPERLRSQNQSPANSIKNSDDDFDNEETFEEWRSGKKNSFWRAWSALAFLVVIGVFIYSIFFGNAVITINPVKHDLVLKETNIPIDSVKHEEITTELNSSEEVTANGTVKVDRKATGKIVLYNAFNSSTQKLVAGTRLETPNGLIYKLKSTVVIPAQKTVSGKKVPGSIEVEIEASETGEKYNQGFKDFNIVAYKGSDRYDSIYGRSKTALANGFSGVVPNILAKDIDSAVSLIKDKIAKDADEYFAKKAEAKGDTFVYIPTAKEITYGSTKQEISKDGKSATIKIDATASTVLFESAGLFEQIIKKQTESDANASTTDETNSIDTSPAEIVYTGDFSKLKVSIEDNEKISVSGTTTISSAIDFTKVTKAVSGLSKEQAIGAVKRLVELETIEIDIRPWWNGKLPSSDKIRIKTEE